MQRVSKAGARPGVSGSLFILSVLLTAELSAARQDPPLGVVLPVGYRNTVTIEKPGALAPESLREKAHITGGAEIAFHDNGQVVVLCRDPDLGWQRIRCWRDFTWVSAPCEQLCARLESPLSVTLIGGMPRLVGGKSPKSGQAFSLYPGCEGEACVQRHPENLVFFLPHGAEKVQIQLRRAGGEGYPVVTVSRDQLGVGRRLDHHQCFSLPWPEDWTLEAGERYELRLVSPDDTFDSAEAAFRISSETPELLSRENIPGLDDEAWRQLEAEMLLELDRGSEGEGSPGMLSEGLARLELLAAEKLQAGREIGVEILEGLAGGYRDLGWREEALDLLEEAGRRTLDSQHHAEIDLWRGDLLLERGLAPDAARAYDRAALRLQSAGDSELAARLELKRVSMAADPRFRDVLRRHINDGVGLEPYRREVTWFPPRTPEGLARRLTRRGLDQRNLAEAVRLLSQGLTLSLTFDQPENAATARRSLKSILDAPSADLDPAIREALAESLKDLRPMPPD